MTVILRISHFDVATESVQTMLIKNVNTVCQYRCNLLWAEKFCSKNI